MIIITDKRNEQDNRFIGSQTKNNKYPRLIQAISVIAVILAFVLLINSQNQIQNDTILKEIDSSEHGQGNSDKLTEYDLDQLGQQFLNQNDTKQAIRIYTFLHYQYPDNLKYLNSLAYSYFVSGDYKNAFLSFEKSLQLDNNNEFTLFYTGLCYIQQQDNQNAEKFFKKTLNINSKHEGALLNLGNLIYGEKERENYQEKSAYYYMKCIESNQKNKECLYKMGILHFNRKSHYKAIKFFKLILDVDPQHPLANCSLGDTYLELKQNYEALIYYKTCVELINQEQQQKELIQYYKKILQIDPNQPHLKNTLAELYFNSKQYDDAYLFYKQVIKNNPKDQKALLAIIKICEIKNNLSDQIYWLKNLIDIKNQNNDEYIQKLGDLNYEIKNYYEAISWYRQLFNKLKQNYSLALKIAQCYVDIADDHAAELWYLKALAIDQQNLISLENLSQLYYYERKTLQAAKYSQQCLSFHSQSLICNKIQGFLNYDDGHYQEASQNFLMALKQSPYDPQALFSLAQTYEALKQFDKASFFYKKCITVNPIASIYKNLADCLIQLNQIEEAIIMLTKSIQLDSSYQDSYLLLAKLYESKNDEQSSIEIYEKYYQIDPYDAAILLKLAQYYQKENQIEKSIHYYKSLIEINQSYEPAYQAISSLFLQSNKIDQGILYFHQLISQNQYNEFAVAQYKYLTAIKK